MKNILITLLKIVFTGSIIAYLIHNGTLDFSKLSIIFTHPVVLISGFSFWLVCAVGISTYRWLLLLRGAGLNTKYLDAIKLQLTGFFFNTVMPGAVGGDLVKAGYVIRQNKEHSKSSVFMTIFLDRLIGMVAFIVAIAVFFLLALNHYKKDDPFEKIFSASIPGFSILLSIYKAIRNYRYHRSSVLKAFLCSILLQAGALINFYIVSLYTVQPELSISEVAAVFPIGFFTVALPVSPGGLGVGHVAFEQLIKLSGSTGGANAFNIYTLLQLFFNLLGCVVYIKMSSTTNLETKKQCI